MGADGLPDRCWSESLLYKYEMIECPDLFQLDGNYVLLFDPQKRDNEKDEPEYSFAASKIVNFDEKTGTLDRENLDEGYTVMDSGFDFYAPQTFLAPDGRRVLFAWMSRMEEEQEKAFAENEPNIHCQTIPRELSVKDGKLYQHPARELYQQLGNEVTVILKSQNVKKAYPENRAFSMRIQNIDLKQNLCMDFHQGEAKIEYNPVEKKIVFSRCSWLTDEWESKECRLENLQEMEVWSDNSSLEIFVNGGILPKDRKPELTFAGITERTNIKIKEII